MNIAAKYFQTDGITCVIEPLSIRPNYYLRSYELAKEIINKLKQPNLKILLDTYHLQRLHGNLTENIEVILIFNIEFLDYQMIIISNWHHTLVTYKFLKFHIVIVPLAMVKSIINMLSNKSIKFIMITLVWSIKVSKKSF